MLQIATSREGALTRITVTLPDASFLSDVCAILRACSAYTTTDSLVQSVRCNRRELDAIQRRLAALQASRAAAPAPVAATSNVVHLRAPAAPAAPTWTRRVMHLAGSPVRPDATVIGSDGQTLKFTGFGREFYCTDELAEPWFHGEPVRYAYYG